MSNQQVRGDYQVIWTISRFDGPCEGCLGNSQNISAISRYVGNRHLRLSKTSYEKLGLNMSKLGN
jgi:hypothetical protein